MKKQLTKLAASASVIALTAVGSASALTITTATYGGQSTPYTLANELNLSATTVNASLVALVEPTTGSLPIGNVLLKIDLANATFPTALTGSNVAGVGAGCTVATASLSSGGGAGSTTVTFLVSNANGCDVAGTEGLQFTGSVHPTGAGSFTLSMNILTEANNQVDGPAATATVLSLVSGLNQAVTASTTLTQAALPTFVAFSTSSDNIIGSIIAGINTSAKHDFTGGAVASTDMTSVTVSVTGDMSAYNTTSTSVGVFVDLDGNSAIGSSEKLTVSGSTASKTFTSTTDIAALTTARNVQLAASGSSAIQASAYSVTVTVNPNTGTSPIPYSGTAEVTSGALQSVTREGTSITMPWFASGTQASSTGSNNLVRIGNVGSTTITALYVEVLNGTLAAPAGVFPLTGVTIPVGGTTLLTSAQLQTAVGTNWGTGDVRITVEAPETALTARRLIFNGTNLTEIGAGTVYQDNHKP